MAIAPYSAGADGPSAAAAIDQTAYQNSITDSNNAADAATAKTRLTAQQTSVTMPNLMSSLGASGQLYGTSAANQVQQSKTAYGNQMADLTTAMSRAHNDMATQQVFASMGLIL